MIDLPNSTEPEIAHRRKRLVWTGADFVQETMSERTPNELGYASTHVESDSTGYFRSVRFLPEGVGPQSSRFSPFGMRRLGTQLRTLDWDCRDLPMRAVRVKTNRILNVQGSLPFSLGASSAPESVKKLFAFQSAATWRAVRAWGYVIAFNTLSLLEPIVAPSAATARLLLSPFSDGFVQWHIQDGNLFIQFPLKEFGFVDSNNLGILMNADEAECIAFWFAGCPDSQLLQKLRRSIDEREVPFMGDSFPQYARLRGIRVDNHMFVQWFSSTMFPRLWHTLTVFDTSTNRGKRWAWTKAGTNFGTGIKIPPVKVSAEEVGQIKELLRWGAPARVRRTRSP